MRNIILLGCGGVGCALLELSILTIFPEYDRIIVIDPRNIHSDPILKFFNSNFDHICVEVTKDNLSSLLATHTRKGDIVVDVSYNIYFRPVIEWCSKNDILYINTSLERWADPNEYTLGNDKSIYERTLHNLHEIAREFGEHKGSTIVLEHGMNPGLITHFVKAGLKKVVKQVLLEADRNSIKLPELLTAYYENDFAKMAMICDLETVHCSERDTQTPKIDRRPGEFMNTWGPYSFYAEGVDPVQIGKGSRNENIKGTVKPLRGDDNMVILPTRGIDIELESYVPPYGKIRGMVIPHGENDTINRLLTVKMGDNIIYRPSTCYVYSPCLVAIDSMREVKESDYKMLPAVKALRGTDIYEGYDAVGALLIFRKDPIQNLIYGIGTLATSYWAGSILDIRECKKLGVRYAGPTVVQVAISLIAAMEWMISNPKEGVCFPEKLPYDRILERCERFLGILHYDWVPYRPK
jgi:homospermidine synthase